MGKNVMVNLRDLYGKLGADPGCVGMRLRDLWRTALEAGVDIKSYRLPAGKSRNLSVRIPVEIYKQVEAIRGYTPLSRALYNLTLAGLEIEEKETII